MSDKERLEMACLRSQLVQFCVAIEVTGGVMIQSKDGMAVPEADHEWIDLGELYMSTCRVLDREPVMYTEGEEKKDENR